MRIRYGLALLLVILVVSSSIAAVTVVKHAGQVIYLKDENHCPEPVIPEAVLNAETSVFMIARLVTNIDNHTVSPIFVGMGADIGNRQILTKFHIFNEPNKKIVDGMQLAVFRSYKDAFYVANVVEFITTEDENDPFVVLQAGDKIHEAIVGNPAPDIFIAKSLKFRDDNPDINEDVYSIEVEADGSYRIITARKAIVLVDDPRTDPVLLKLKRKSALLADDTANPGSSGSVLVDKNGYIVGILFAHSAYNNRSTAFEPIDKIRKKLLEKHIIK